VTRRDRHLRIASLDDPRLRTLRIGLHTIGDDYANVPPAEALAARGIVDNIVGYSIYGDYSQPDPPRRLIDALARGEVDVAIAWGPLAGYLARRESVALEVSPVSTGGMPVVPMAFDISVGVRRGDAALQTAIEEVLVRRRLDVRKLLLSYGVPLVDPQSESRT
jgi:mxaJ protein